MQLARRPVRRRRRRRDPPPLPAAAPDGRRGRLLPARLRACSRAGRCIAGLAAQARAAGADLREGVTVTGVTPDGDGVSGRDRRRRHRGRRLRDRERRLDRAAARRPLGLTPAADRAARSSSPSSSRVDPAEFVPGRFPLLIARLPGHDDARLGLPDLGRAASASSACSTASAPVVDPGGRGPLDRSPASGRRLDAFVAQTIAGPHRPRRRRRLVPVHDDPGRGLHPRPPPGAPADRDRARPAPATASSSAS